MAVRCRREIHTRLGPSIAQHEDEHHERHRPHSGYEHSRIGPAKRKCNHSADRGHGDRNREELRGLATHEPQDNHLHTMNTKPATPPTTVPLSIHRVPSSSLPETIERVAPSIAPTAA